MTSPSDAAPPDRRAPRSGDLPRPGPPPPVVDFFVGLLSVALDVAACLPFALGLGFQGWADAGRGSRNPGPPPMDWGPTVAFGVILVLVALSAIGLGVAKMPVSAFLQSAAAVVLVFVVAGVTSDEHHRSHPRPAVTSTWAPYTGPVCYSGGDNCP